MYVYERMTKRPTTVTEDYSIAQAYQIMNECRYSQLPVVNSENKLLGLLTEKAMAEYSPSKASSLSMYELGYILTKTKVKDVMAKKVFTVTKDTFIEEAAVLMKENRINSLPVVENGYLIGILTKTDIFSAFIDLMGTKSQGARITISADNKPGLFADITGVFASRNIDIRNFTNINEGSKTEITIKLRTCDIDESVAELKEKGYEIKNITVQKY